MGVLALMLPEYHGTDWPWSPGWDLDTHIFKGKLYQNRIDFHFFIKFMLPCASILIVRRKIRDFGLGLGKVKLGIKMCVLFYILYIPCFCLLFADDSTNQYYRNSLGLDTLGSLLERQLFSVFIFMLTTEFLFRGYLLLGLRKYYGEFAAVCISIIPFVLVHIGKPEMEALGSYPVGLALSYLALKTNSIWYGVFLHWSIAILYYLFLFAFHGGI